MSLKLTILGANSAIPAYGRNHTAQVLFLGNKHFLIDCGEGTQNQAARFGVKIQKVHHIFISHLHGDHYLGLMGVLSSMHLLGRKKPLYLYGPVGLKEIISVQLKYSETALKYPLIFQELEPEGSGRIYEDKMVEVDYFPLDHRITCHGFLFREKPKPRKIVKEKLPQNISIGDLAKLKKGLDLTDADGKITYLNKTLTSPPPPSMAYAYCSDTKYNEAILAYVKGVDMMYHEATFPEEKELWASQTYHTTARQAGIMATKAGVKMLIIGHYSARYRELDVFLEESQKEFKNTHLAIEGNTYTVENGDQE